MNFIDAFFVDEKYFQNKLYKDSQISVEELKKIPIEEILKSEKSICHLKKKTKKDTCNKNFTNKENKKLGNFSEDYKRTKSRKQLNGILTERLNNTEGRENKRTCKVTSYNEETFNLSPKEQHIDENRESIQSVLTEANNVKPKQKKRTYIRHPTKKAEENDHNDNRKNPLVKLIKLNNDEMNFEGGANGKVLRNENKENIHLSSEDHKKEKVRKTSHETFSEINSSTTTVRKSNRIRQKNKNLSSYEIDNGNNNVAKKKAKNVSQITDIRTNILKHKVPATKNIISKTIYDEICPREIRVVCERVNETDERVDKTDLLDSKLNKKQKVSKQHKSEKSKSPKRNLITIRSQKNKKTKANNTIACIPNDNTLSRKQNKISITNDVPNKSCDDVSLGEDLEKNKELTKKASRAIVNKGKKLPTAERSYKKASKGTTFKHLKERQKLYKENLNKSKDSLEEFPLVKKNKALEDLMNANADETLTIKTPKLKNKQSTMGGITPRSSLISELEKDLASSKLITPKDSSKKAKTKSKEENGALHVLYKHLDTKMSRKRKNTVNVTKINSKIPKITTGEANVFKNSNEEELLSSLSQKPSQDKDDDDDDDDYFNQSV